MSKVNELEAEVNRVGADTDNDDDDEHDGGGMNTRVRTKDMIDGILGSEITFTCPPPPPC